MILKILFFSYLNQERSAYLSRYQQLCLEFRMYNSRKTIDPSLDYSRDNFANLRKFSKILDRQLILFPRGTVIAFILKSLLYYRNVV